MTIPFTFADLTYQVARLVGGNVVQTGTATGGSTTTLIDTVRRTEEDDYWNLGTVWILKSTDGAAPQGEVNVVRDFVATTDTLTVDAFSATIGSGDIYAICKRRYPLHVFELSVNQAIQELGAVPRVDTSLTTVAGQTEYTIPTAAQHDLREVFIQTNDDSDDNQWQKVVGWEIKHGDTSANDLLIFDREYTAGLTIRLDHMARHDELFVYSDELQPDVPVERIIYRAALYSLNWYRDKTRTDDFEKHARYLEEKADEFDRTKPMSAPVRSNKLLYLNRR